MSGGGAVSSGRSLLSIKRGLWLATLLVLLVQLAYLPRPRGPNLGLPFGYFGKFNRITAEIESRPGVEIVDVALHRDLTLEDFWITVRLPDGQEVELAFPNANVRSFQDLAQELGRLPSE